MSQQDGRRKLIRVKPHGNGFGFTLRFCADDTPGGQPSESIVFIKSVVSKGPASVAGLSPGDRIEAINGRTVNGRSYKEIIAEIKESENMLELLVTPHAVVGELVDDTKVRIKCINAHRLSASDFDKKRSSTESETSQHRRRILSSGSSLSAEIGESQSGSHHSQERLGSCSTDRLASADFSRPRYSSTQYQAVVNGGGGGGRPPNIQRYTSVPEGLSRGPEGLSRGPEAVKTSPRVMVAMSSMYYQNSRGRTVGQLASQSMERLDSKKEGQYNVEQRQGSSPAAVIGRRRGGAVNDSRVHPPLEGRNSGGTQLSDYNSDSLTSHGTCNSSIVSLKSSDISSGYTSPQLLVSQTPVEETHREGSISSGAETVQTQVSVRGEKEGASEIRTSGDGGEVAIGQWHPWVKPKAGDGDVYDGSVSSRLRDSDRKTVGHSSEDRARPLENERLTRPVKSSEVVVRLRAMNSPSNMSHQKTSGQSNDKRRTLTLGPLRGDAASSTPTRLKLTVPVASGGVGGELESPAALYNETELQEIERTRNMASFTNSVSQGQKNTNDERCSSVSRTFGQYQGRPLAPAAEQKDSLKLHCSHDDVRADPAQQTVLLMSLQDLQDLQDRTQSERALYEGSLKLKRGRSNSVPDKKGAVLRRSAAMGEQVMTEAANLQSPKKVELSDEENKQASPKTQTYFSSRKFQFDGFVPVDESHSLPPNIRKLVPRVVALPYMDPLAKSGYLNRKQTVESSGKRAKDRSWKIGYYELRGHVLYSYRDEREAKKPEHSEEQPLSVKFCRVDIAYDYQKKPNAFRVTAYNGSEFLFQAASSESMMEWIEAIKSHSDPDHDLENKAHADLIIRKAVEQRQKRVERGLSFSNRSRRSPARSVSGSRLKENGTRDSGDGMLGSPRRNLFSRKTSGGQQDGRDEEEFNGFFKRSLNDCEMSDAYKDVPLFVVKCVEEVEKRGIDVEGIYRVSGNKSEMRLLMDEIQKDLATVDFVDERWCGINNVTSLLKLFLRELGQPIFPKDLYDNFMSASKVDDQDQRLIMLKQLIQELPHLNYCTLCFLSRHLHRIASRAESNRMYPKNLAIVFGPTLVRREVTDMEHIMSDMGNQCNIVELLLVHCNWFFGLGQQDDRKLRPFLRPSLSCDVLNVVSQAGSATVDDGEISVSSVQKVAPPKPQRTMEYDPEDPDDGIEHSDFWQRYPPRQCEPDLAAKVSAAAQMDATSRWINQMSSQAWQTESGSSSPASFRKLQPEKVLSDGSLSQPEKVLSEGSGYGSGSREQSSEPRGSQSSMRSLGGSHQSIGYQRALQALQAVAKARSGGRLREGEMPGETIASQNAGGSGSSSGMVIRRERRGRRNWRGAKVTDSGDLSGENVNVQPNEWSRVDSIGKIGVGVGVQRYSPGERSSEARETEIRTTLL